MISEHTHKEPAARIDTQPTLPENGEVETYHDVELEKRTLRKFDFYVLPQFMIMVLIAYLDRSNIGTT